jgi:hypothetical protein
MAFPASIKAPVNGAYIGSFNNVAAFESVTGRHPAIGMVYKRWTYGSTIAGFPASDLDAIYSKGSIPVLVWEPWIYNQPAVLDTILSGQWDNYIRDYAIAAHNYGKPLFLRFAHEMDGDWYPWGGPVNGALNTSWGDPKKKDGPEKFVAVWKRVHDIFVQQNATNVYWVWSPNQISSWSTKIEVSEYYPGNNYVDWLGTSGFNWNYAPWDGWKSFDTVYSYIYGKFNAIAPNKPWMIAEISSCEDPNNATAKAAWITDTFAKIKSPYSKFKAIVWFNQDNSGNGVPECNWRIDSSSAAANAARNALNNSYFVSVAQQ